MLGGCPLESIDPMTIEPQGGCDATKHPSAAQRAWDGLVGAAAQGVAAMSRSIGAGAGMSAPGVVIDRLDPGFVQRRGRTLSATTTLVSGTNGKTTTAAMLVAILEAAGRRVLTNGSGANLFRGVAASLATARGEDAAVFEVDEAALPRVAGAIEPQVLVLTNVFRDQLDRFAEPELVARLLSESARVLPEGSRIVANADDPLLWNAVEDLEPTGFGVRLSGSARSSRRHDADPEICPRCGGAVRYRRRTFGHLGACHCATCGWASSDPAFLVDVIEDDRIDRLHLSIEGLTCELAVGGTHNAYNAAAAVAAASFLGIPPSTSIDALASFVPKFGRAERLSFDDRALWVLLAKNPVSCSTATRQVLSDPRIRAVVILVNDHVADGRDVSWIWDAGLEAFVGVDVPILAGGSRADDVALRFRYAGGAVEVVDPDIESLLRKLRAITKPSEDIAVLATYTAMLELRRALLGSRRAQVSDTTPEGEGRLVEGVHR